MLIKDKLNKLLGYSCLGSKSGYRENNPGSDPVFNATIMSQHLTGELEKVWFGDLDLKDEETIKKIKDFCLSEKSVLYVYRESVVNNAVFNGYMFPYTSYSVMFTPQGVFPNDF